MSYSGFSPDLNAQLLDTQQNDNRATRSDSLIDGDSFPGSLSAQSKESSADVAVTVKQFKEMMKHCEKHLKKYGKDHESTQMMIGQIFLAFVGVFAGFLYFDPAKECAAGSCDDGWLADAIPPEIVRQYIYFISGFIGFASTNCTFSYYGPQVYMEMLSDINSVLGKVFATGGVLSFLVMQGIQIKLSADGTGSSPLMMMMSVTGSIPGAVFGGVGMISQVRKIPAKISNLMQYCYDNLRFNSLPLEKHQAMAKELFYAKQRKIFNTVLAANWKDIVAHAQTIPVDVEENKIHFLLQRASIPKRTSIAEKGFRYLMKGVGGVLATSVTACFANNTKQELEKKMNDSYGQVALTGLLNASSTYGNFVLINKAVDATSDVLVSKIKGEPIDSLVYQLRPGMSRAIIGSSVAFAIFSYAVIDKTWNALWAPSVEGGWQTDWQSAGRGVARAGIDVYHAVGPADVGMQLLFKWLLTKGTPREQYLANAKLVADYLLSELPQSEFIELINHFTFEERDHCGVETWDAFLQQLQHHDEAEKAAIVKEMGLGKFSEAIIDLTKPLPKEVRVDECKVSSMSPKKSPTAAHWSSPTALLPPPASQDEKQQAVCDVVPSGNQKTP